MSALVPKFRLAGICAEGRVAVLEMDRPDLMNPAQGTRGIYTF
jgi:hypothetical protein